MRCKQERLTDITGIVASAQQNRCMCFLHQLKMENMCVIYILCYIKIRRLFLAHHIGLKVDNSDIALKRRVEGKTV